MKYSIGLVRSAPKKPPIFLRFRSSEALIISTVSLAIFTDIFLYGEVIPILPFALESRVGIPKGSVQSSVSILLAVYAAGLIAASPIVGWTADHFETRRSSLMAGLAALLGSTFMLCFGTSEAILIVARVLQGISAAVVWTVGLALIVDTVGEARVGSAMAYASSAMSIGLIIGPVLGGVIYARSGYYAAFGLAFAFIGLDLVLRVILVEKKIAIRYQHTPQVSEVSEEESPTNIKLETLPGSAVPAETIAAETAEPSSRPRNVSAVDSTLPPVIYILRYPRLLVALLLSFNQAIFLSALDATLPLYLNALFGFTAFQAGLIYMAVAVPVFFISPLAGWLCDRSGPKVPAVVGLLASVPCFVLLRLPHADQENPTGQVVVLCVILAFLGASLTFLIPPSMAEIALIAGEHGAEAYGQAYGLFNVAFSGGFLVGPLWGGYVTQKAGWNVMVGSLAGLAGVSVIPVAIWTGGWMGWKDTRSHFVGAFRRRRPQRQEQE